MAYPRARFLTGHDDRASSLRELLHLRGTLPARRTTCGFSSWGILALGLARQRDSAHSRSDSDAGRQLTLEQYKATIKGLTQFGDRRAGTDRNRAAIDWIEAQLKSYGCTNTQRLTYDYPLNIPRPSTATGAGRRRGVRASTGVNNDPNAQPDARLRELNAQPAANGPREEVYCTKVGAIHPEEMYIISAHMDGIGYV